MWRGQQASRDRGIKKLAGEGKGGRAEEGKGEREGEGLGGEGIKSVGMRRKNRG